MEHLFEEAPQWRTEYVFDRLDTFVPASTKLSATGQLGRADDGSASAGEEAHTAWLHQDSRRESRNIQNQLRLDYLVSSLSESHTESMGLSDSVATSAKVQTRAPASRSRAQMISIYFQGNLP